MDKADLISASLCPLECEEWAGPQRMGGGGALVPFSAVALSDAAGREPFLHRAARTGENRVASRCPSVALAEQNQVVTLPVRLLKDDMPVVQGNGHANTSFQMKMDAHGFAPDDLMVRVDGQNLTVTGQRQHESNDPVRGGYRIKQTVHRQMQLPRNIDPAAMTCSLTPSGHLWVLGQNRSLPPPDAPTSQAPRHRSHGPKNSNRS